LLKYDSILGRLDHEVRVTDDGIDVGGRHIKGLAIKEGPGALPWGDLGVDIVIESTGIFTKAAQARQHVDSSGAKKVIISAPATDEDITIVLGVNEDAYDGSQTVISNASYLINLATSDQALWEKSRDSFKEELQRCDRLGIRK